MFLFFLPMPGGHASHPSCSGLAREATGIAHHFTCGERKVCHLVIYLLSLFNVDYKTLAAYALIKIDYPPPAPPPHLPPSHKKHNKNVNKSVKEENRMCIQFFQINPTCWMYVLHILHGHFSPFHFPIFFLKRSKEDEFLVFLGTRFHI